MRELKDMEVESVSGGSRVHLHWWSEVDSLPSSYEKTVFKSDTMNGPSVEGEQEAPHDED